MGGDVYDSVLFTGAEVEKGAVVRDSVVMPGAKIEKGAIVQYAIVAENAVIKSGAVVGKRPEEAENIEDWGVATIGPGIVVGENETVPPCAMLGI